jgi:hypothetical protein
VEQAWVVRKIKFLQNVKFDFTPLMIFKCHPINGWHFLLLLFHKPRYYLYSFISRAITFILSSAAVAASSINGWHFLFLLFHQPQTFL